MNLVLIFKIIKIKEAGANAVLEVAYTLANGIEYIKTGLNAGLNVDDFASGMTFSWVNI
jgi:methylmalonyl-CoA mutase